jgi:hypothetical protein
MYRSDGSVYIGQFNNGTANGNGIYILPDGTYYEGFMVDNKAEGKGYLKAKDL